MYGPTGNVEQNRSLPTPGHHGVNGQWKAPRAPASGEPPYGEEILGIRRRAAGIVELVLKDPTPEHAWARDLLREHLAAHPGTPEIALAEHLIAVRSVRRQPADDKGYQRALGTYAREGIDARIDGS